MSPHNTHKSNQKIQYIGNPTWPKYQGGGYNCMFNLAMDTTEPGFQNISILIGRVNFWSILGKKWKPFQTKPFVLISFVNFETDCTGKELSKEFLYTPTQNVMHAYARFSNLDRNIIETLWKQEVGFG